MINNKRLHAGFFIRLIAFYIDIFICGLIVFIMLFIIGLTIRVLGNKFMGFETILGEAGLSILVQGTGFFIMSLYYILFHWKYGATPGKKILKIKVVNRNYKRINFKTSVIRFLLFLISLIVLGLGCVWVIFNKEKQSFHDIIAKTYVIYSK